MIRQNEVQAPIPNKYDRKCNLNTPCIMKLVGIHSFDVGLHDELQAGQHADDDLRILIHLAWKGTGEALFESQASILKEVFLVLA